jgi:starch synthase
MPTSAAIKTRFQKDFKLAQKEKSPLVIINLDYFPLNKLELLPTLIEGILTLEIQVVILKNRKAIFERIFKNLKYDQSQLVFLDPQYLERAYTAADLMLFLTEREDLTEPVKTALQSGLVPIIFKSEEYDAFLQNYDPLEEKGNAFTYGEFSSWRIFAAVVKALENYQFPYDWQNIVKTAKKVK